MIRYETRPDPAAVMRAQPRRCKRGIVEKLADAIREMGHAGEVITSEALKLRGFSERIVKAHGEAAVALARRQSIRYVQA